MCLYHQFIFTVYKLSPCILINLLPMFPLQCHCKNMFAEALTIFWCVMTYEALNSILQGYIKVHSICIPKCYRPVYTNKIKASSGFDPTLHNYLLASNSVVTSDAYSTLSHMTLYRCWITICYTDLDSIQQCYEMLCHGTYTFILFLCRWTLDLEQ